MIIFSFLRNNTNNNKFIIFLRSYIRCNHNLNPLIIDKDENHNFDKEGSIYEFKNKIEKNIKQM